MKEFFENYRGGMYFTARILFGLMFILHGYEKVFGGSFNLFSQMGLAGVIEVLGGAFIVLGLFVRTTSLIAALEMLVAYFQVHWPNGFSPLANRGEAAVLFFAVFLIFMTYGAGKYSLEKVFFDKELF